MPLVLRLDIATSQICYLMKLLATFVTTMTGYIEMMYITKIIDGLTNFLAVLVISSCYY